MASRHRAAGAFKVAEHLSDMLRFRRAAPRTGKAGPDVVHYQWLTFPALDALLLPPTGLA